LNYSWPFLTSIDEDSDTEILDDPKEAAPSISRVLPGSDVIARGPRGTPANIVRLARKIATRSDPSDVDVQRLVAAVEHRRLKKIDTKRRSKVNKVAKKSLQKN